MSVIVFMMTVSAFPQGTFSVKMTRPQKFFGSWSSVRLFYLGEEKTVLKNKAEFTFTGALPADSIIELSFKVPLQLPIKYFLYPNGTFSYDLITAVNFNGVKVTDMSVYPGRVSSGVAEKKKILPKGMSVNKSNLAVSYVYERTLPSDEIRKQWARQGGKIVGRSLSYNISYTSYKDAPNKMKMVGGGAGWNYTQNYYNLVIPEYKPGIVPWHSLVYGAGFSTSLSIATTTIDQDPPAEDIEATGGSFYFMLSGNIGYTLGLGKFKTESDYKGVAIDFVYRPSVILSVSEGGSDTQFNYKGFGIDVTRTSFSAFAARLAPKAKSKFSFFMLPPIGKVPFMVSFGYGRIWYR